MAALRADGLAIDWDPNIHSQRGYLADSDAARARAFNRAMAVHRHFMCTRGGYGSLRILNRIDYATARARPGLLIGFSDITALQLSLYGKAGWRSLSGPVVVEWSEIPESMKTDCLALTRGELPAPIDTLEPMRSGIHTGTLLGGNLSTIARMVGTPYLPEMDGAVLFIEDVNEPPYRIDALFAQLHLAGVLARIGGLLVGRFTRSTPEGNERDFDPLEIVADYAAPYSWPIATGLNYGHFHPRQVIPIGVKATLEVNREGACLNVLEAAVRSNF